MAGLTDSGYPLTAGLRLLERQGGKRERQLFSRILSGIEEGRPLSHVLAEEQFPPLVLSLVTVGEASGDLPQTLYRLSRHYERKRAFRRELWGVALYPLIVTVVAFGILLFLLYVVLPQFSYLYLQMAFPLPPATERLFRWAAVGRLALPWLAGGALLASFLLFYLWRKDPRRMQRPFLPLLSLPFCKEIYRMILSQRLVENMALLLAAGIPLLSVLQKMKETAVLPFEEEMVLAIRERILAGSSLSRALGEEPWVDERVLLAMEIAEATGELPEFCAKVAAEMAEELHILSKRALQWLEPCLLLLIGGVVGMITTAVVLPMLDMVQSFT